MIYSNNKNVIKNSLYFTGAAGSVAIAGILHLVLVSMAIKLSFALAIFFVIAGVSQIFWTIPTIKQWNRKWHYIGISGNVLLVVIWIISRFPELNPYISPFSAFDFGVLWFEGEYLGCIVTGILSEKKTNKS